MASKEVGSSSPANAPPTQPNLFQATSQPPYHSVVGAIEIPSQHKVWKRRGAPCEMCASFWFVRLHAKKLRTIDTPQVPTIDTQYMCEADPRIRDHVRDLPYLLLLPDPPALATFALYFADPFRHSPHMSHAAVGYSGCPNPVTPLFWTPRWTPRTHTHDHDHEVWAVMRTVMPTRFA